MTLTGAIHLNYGGGRTIIVVRVFGPGDMHQIPETPKCGV